MIHLYYQKKKMMHLDICILIYFRLWKVRKHGVVCDESGSVDNY